MRRVTWAALAVLFSSLLVVGGGVRAHATNGPQIVNSASNQIVAMNKKGGSNNDGTQIIGWHPGDNNNTFEWLHELDRCGGQVTLSCPFTDSFWNSVYDGYALVRIYNYAGNNCLIDGGTGLSGGVASFWAMLQGCNISTHTYVLVGCFGNHFDTCADSHFNTVINVDDTNTNSADTPVCLQWSTGSGAIGGHVWTNDDCASDASGNFQQIP